MRLRPSSKGVVQLKSRKVAMEGLFKPARRHGNVVLNFRRAPRAEFGPYGEAFWRSASDLAKKLASSQGYRDTDACPIVFLYRHALELYMKAIVISGRKLVRLSGRDVDVDALGDHPLTPLVPTARAIFAEMRWSWERDAGQVEMVLKELDRLDPHSFTFRYPTNKKGKGHVPHHFGFNVLEFADRAESALRLLDGALTGIEEALGSAAEAAAAHQELMEY